MEYNVMECIENSIRYNLVELFGLLQRAPFFGALGVVRRADCVR